MMAHPLLSFRVGEVINSTSSSFRTLDFLGQKPGGLNGPAESMRQSRQFSGLGKKQKSP